MNVSQDGKVEGNCRGTRKLPKKRGHYNLPCNQLFVFLVTIMFSSKKEKRKSDVGIESAVFFA